MTEKTIPSLIVLVGGLIALFFSLKELYHSQISSSWPTTIAKVESLEKTKRKGRSGRSKFRKNAINLGSAEYNFNITYSYEIDEIEYLSKRFNFKVFNTMSENDVNKAIDEYSKKKIIYVYYNPHNKSQSTVEVGLNYKNFILLGIACFLLMLFFLINRRIQLGSAIG